MQQSPRSTIYIVALSAITTVVLIGIIGVIAVTLAGGNLSALIMSPADRKEEVREVIHDTDYTLEDQIVSTLEETTPAVVSIAIEKEVPVYNSQFPQFFGSLFPEFQPAPEGGDTETQVVGGGSGFFVSSDGYIVTNRHVVSDTNATYIVYTASGESHTASVVARDPVLDIAVLAIEGTGYPSLSFGDSDAVRVGQTAIAIGNALAEFDNTVSVGVISGLSRSIVAGGQYGNSEVLDRVIQTDAAINLGNSGGPLLDSTGRVIGVNVARAQASENIGFAIPSNSVARIVESVQEHGEIVRPFLGVRYQMITDTLVEKNNLSVDHGALIIRGRNDEQLAVIPGSPADKAGLEENDIILEINGDPVTTEQPLAYHIRSYSVGEAITLTIYQDGERRDVTATLEKFEED